MTECKSWVWKASTRQCFLKSDYDANKNTIKCDDCVAYTKGGGYYLYHKSTTLGDYTTWAQSTGIWMPKSVAAQLCRVKQGFDQPEKYNMEGSPIEVQFSYMCCNECARHHGGEIEIACLPSNS